MNLPQIIKKVFLRQNAKETNLRYKRECHFKWYELPYYAIISSAIKNFYLGIINIHPDFIVSTPPSFRLF